MDVRREQDIEQLRRVALMQQVQIEQLLKVLSSQSHRIDKLTGNQGELQQSLALLEKLHKENAPTSESAVSESSSIDSPKKEERKPRDRSGPTPQPKLPLVPQVYELDEADRACPKCGQTLTPIEGQFETSEMIDVIEVSYRVVQVQQQKYNCGCGGCVETALGPERAIRGGRYSLPFAVKVAVDKYLDHLPLARQVRILSRHGVEVTSQTLWSGGHAKRECVESARLGRVVKEGTEGPRAGNVGHHRATGVRERPKRAACRPAGRRGSGVGRREPCRRRS